MSVFKTLSAINVSAKTEKKAGFTYLSWAWAWSEACKVCEPHRKVYENINGLNYHTDGKTAWVKVGVKIGDIEHIDYLPVMNNRNKSIELNAITSYEVNKAIQRSTVKALALHGLGLNVYAGEDLPITPTLPNVAEVSTWIGNGKTKEECLAHIASLGCNITAEYKQKIEEL